MKIRLDFTKSVWENASRYFEEAKRLRAKAEGARKAADATRKKIEWLEKKIAGMPATVPQPKFRIKESRKREWFERFRWFETSGGFLALAGKDAKQNEVLVARHLEPKDLFFHADVHGAAAVVLKNGTEAGEKDLRETAQFAACYSNAWRLGSGAVDVYAVRAEQVGKYSHGEFVAKGGFVIRGERKWFKNTELRLVVAEKGGRISVSPALLGVKGVVLVPGDFEKNAVAKKIVERFGAREGVDEIAALLPGKSGFE